MEPVSEEKSSPPISADIQENIDRLKDMLNHCSDAVIREFAFGKEKPVRCVLLYFDGLSNKVEIEANLLKSLQLELEMTEDITLDAEHLVQQIQDRVLSLAELKPLNTLDEVCHQISSGDSVLLLDGYKQGLVSGTRSWQTRSVATPDTELVVHGPKEGFNETLRINTAMLRRRLKSNQFKIESMVLGRVTQTDVVICYIENIAPENLVNEVRERLSHIDIDGVLDTGYLEEFIADTRMTIFSQVEYTEKPDRVSAHLLEGRICILVDGSPMALVVPTNFPQFLVSPEDYYQGFIAGSIYRLIRVTAFFTTLLLPSLYVAIKTFHPEMIPLPLFLTIAASREAVPFPAVIEALIMEITFEFLREAGLRLPRAIGPAVSIVGALIIGDAAVKAGLVSTATVVVIAFTGIASFIIPAYNASVIIRILRFGMLLTAGVMGIPGIIIALLILLIRMENITSLGQPYLAPLSPLNLAQVSDILVRRPWSLNTCRPYWDGMQNQKRQNKSPEKGGG